MQQMSECLSAHNRIIAGLRFEEVQGKNAKFRVDTVLEVSQSLGMKPTPEALLSLHGVNRKEPSRARKTTVVEEPDFGAQRKNKMLSYRWFSYYFLLSLFMCWLDGGEAKVKKAVITID